MWSSSSVITRSNRLAAGLLTSATGLLATASSCVANPLSGAESAHLAAIANDLEADLIVARALGHSRLRGWAFGGVTRDLPVKAERCILVSH